MPKRARDSDPISVSQTGANYVATVTDASTGKHRRRYFPIAPAAYEDAVSWLRSQGSRQTGEPLPAKPVIDSEAPCASDFSDMNAAQPPPEAPLACDDATPSRHGVVTIISEGDEVLSNAECPADDARSGLTKGCALTSDCSTGCVMVEPSSGVGVAAEAPCLDVIATTIARRSRCVRSLGVYWGFAEWVVWGILKQTRVLMLCADNIIDIAATFCGEEMRHRPS